MIKKTCKQCGKEFTITDSEIKFYKEKNLDLPKRCSDCRKKNKQRNNENNTDIKIENNLGKVTNITNNISSNEDKKKSSKIKILSSILIVGLVLAFIYLGNLFNILPNWDTIRAGFENLQKEVTLEFRSEKLWEEHFEKHKNEFTYNTKEEYLEGANEVINSPNSMEKAEGEDGDKIYYDQEKNEIVFVSTDGYIRTYFRPSEGISYFNRQ